MIIGAVVVVVLGMLTWVLASSAGYRRSAVHRLAVDMGERAPDAGRTLLEERVRRRTRALGIGFMAAGVVLLVVHLAWTPDGEAVGGPWIVSALAFAFGAVALAVVEIWWPITLEGGTVRTARSSVPTLEDYVPRFAVTPAWSLTIFTLLSLAAVLVLGQVAWFDGTVVLGGPVPALAIALMVLAIVTVVAVHRVLDAPQPSRDQRELYWQDALRASTLSSLHRALALVAVVAFAAVAETLDAAASAVATASGQVGPEWTGAVLVLAYILTPLVFLAGVVCVLGTFGRGEKDRFRRRLWPSTGDAGAHRGAGA